MAITEEVLGPPTRVAFKDGKPTRAAEAFAEKLGVKVEDLRRVNTPRGECLAGTRTLSDEHVEARDKVTDFQSYISDLSKVDLQDDAAFLKHLTFAFRHLVTDKELAEEFGASRPTVTRWRNGQNAPHSASRRTVLDYLQQRAQQLSRKNTGTSSASPGARRSRSRRSTSRRT